MLQRHIIYKQLQELQRRQQFQGLCEVRNQDYLNQLSSLKHGLGTQFPATVNLAPGPYPQVFMVGNMQMMQHGLVHPMNLPPTEFGASYESSLMNNHKNISQHSHLQVPSNFSETILTQSDCSTLGMHPSASPNSLMNQEFNSFMHQMQKSDDLWPPNEVSHENIRGHVSGESFNSHLLSDNGYQQGSVIQGSQSLLTSEVRHEDADSLDPLEQKILYNASDNIWETSFSTTSKMGEYEGGVDSSPYMDGFRSMQSGSWSALMQSAVAETSSSKTGMQEEWSGVSSQHPEVSINDQPSNTMDSNNGQNDWLDRNLQNVSSPCSNLEQLVPESDMNSSFPGFQPGHLKWEGKFQLEASHFSDQNHSQSMSHLADNNPQETRPTEVNELISTSLLLPNRWSSKYKENDEHQPSAISCTNDTQPEASFSGNERGTFWPSEGGSYHVSAIKPFDQLNQKNTHKCSVQSQKMGHSNNAETMPAFLGSFANPHVQNMMTHRNVGDEAPEAHLTSLPKPWNALPVPQGLGFQQNPADPRTTQLYSCYPSFSMGGSNSAAASSDNVKEHSQNKPIVSQGTTMFPRQNTASPQINFQLKRTQSTGTQFPYEAINAQPSATSVASQHMGSRSSTLSLQQESFPIRGDFSTTNYNVTSYERALINARELLLKGQMDPSLFNNNATLNNEEKASGTWPSSASNIASSKESPGVLPLDDNHQSSALLLTKKHMTPWHQEVCEQLSLQKISSVEQALASNRRQEEAQNVSEAIEDLVPLVRAKRRLITTTHIIQQVFRPPPAVILSADASLNYDCMPYFSARLAIADACSHVNILPDGTTREGSPNTPDKTRKRRFSHVVEDLISRTKKLEGDLSRVDRSLSILDVRIENEETEKFAVMNRFAKFHIKANPTTASDGYRNLQRYVTMRKAQPDQAVNCISL